ncbi:hypothetical protein J2X36_000322 [Methylobacterium sp. BE186]|uniref:hypothetical protein n=1 Tax=Methylobacterium sp. BE186 TaxID=2817715 RepID=UPI002866FD6A|nr:hypothetical protein [Methylobacterium sp. BE186]MDR7035587.1 hypothetical protein [Methylobacterium sp. BE186]
MPVSTPARLRGCRFGTAAALSLGLALAIAGPALGQDLPRLDPGRGALLIHGNYCGPGNRGPAYPPVDALDVACMHHDACTPPPGDIARCACHDRLHAEAGLVASNPAVPRALRDKAKFVSDAAMLLPCLD